MTPEEKGIMTKAQRISRWNAQKLYYSTGKQYQRKWTVKRGEVYFVDLGENVGSEENKLRPVVVLQSDAYNFKSPVFTCAIISASALTIPDIQVPITGTYHYKDENGVNKFLVGSVDLGQIKTEEEYNKESLYRVLSLLSVALIDLGLIEIDQSYQDVG